MLSSKPLWQCKKTPSLLPYAPAGCVPHACHVPGLLIPLILLLLLLLLLLPLLLLLLLLLL